MIMKHITLKDLESRIRNADEAKCNRLLLNKLGKRIKEKTVTAKDAAESAHISELWAAYNFRTAFVHSNFHFKPHEIESLCFAYQIPVEQIFAYDFPRLSRADVRRLYEESRKKDSGWSLRMDERKPDREQDLLEQLYTQYTIKRTIYMQCVGLHYAKLKDRKIASIVSDYPVPRKTGS